MVGRYLYGHIRCMGRFGIAAVVGLVLLLAPVARADVQTDLQHARDLFNAPDYPKAVDALQPLLADPTVGPEALHMMALCYQNRADYAKAITYYDLLFKDFPKSDLSGVVLKETRLACTTLAGDFKGAVAYARILIKDYPTAPQVPYWQLSIGQASASDKNWPEAIKALEAALAAAKEPADADLIKNINPILAGCYEGGEEWEKLAKLSEDMAEKKPEEAVAWQRRASIGYERRGNYTQAIQSIEAAIKIATVSKDTALLKELNVRLPEMYRLSGRTEEAEKMRLKLAADDPSNAAEHLFWYAMCFKNRNQFQQAADHFQEVYDKYPDNLMGQNALMEVYGCLIMVPGKSHEAQAAYKTLWDKHPDFRAEALFIASEIESASIRNPEKALTLLARLIKEYPDSLVAKRRETSLMRIGLLDKVGKYTEVLEAIESLDVPQDGNTIEFKLEISEIKAYTLLHLDRVTEAIEVATHIGEQCQSIENKQRALRLKATVGQKGKRIDVAVDAYRQLLRITQDPVQCAEYRYQLGLCHHISKELSLATSYMQDVASNNADTHWAKLARGALHAWSLESNTARPNITEHAESEERSRL